MAAYDSHPRAARAIGSGVMGPRVRAVLGPTNTGKTHLAMERLLAHASGIIGFPLRLLARENYDRMVAAKGADRVALITGEEKIVPAGARWFACTVEAMPLDRAVEFVAVDEIQLCADPDRGHVFTERLLAARGLVETMFLGAETIRPLMRRLVPGIAIETRPRLSQLCHAGAARLAKLPPRSAVVAFSAAEVYAIAEQIRRRRGGCAVVMGRLSPRTRNAQVALYQHKEVDFLVATDAIGMGLNMDVDHVAFAGRRKFDGHRPRPLRAAELAQIAGRAGRGMRDGTFGVTARCPPLDEALARAIETHDFEPLAQLAWRNAALDFSSVDALLASLQMPPPHAGLVRGDDASDLETLAALAHDPDIRAAARGRERVRLLWEVCQIPDFRKLADETHHRLCARIFALLLAEGEIPADWLAARIASISRADGDIDTLMQRLAGVRVWSYVAARTAWVAQSAHWQAEARAVEEQLSDTLHERLTARFVDRRAAVLMRGLDRRTAPLLSAVTGRGEVVVEGVAVGRVEGFGFAPDAALAGDGRKLALRAARRALHEEIPRRVAALEAAADSAFALALAPATPPAVLWNGIAIATLRPGASLLRPLVEVAAREFLDGARRERVRQRLQRFVAAHVARVLAPLCALTAADEPALRGPLHRVVEALGVAAGEGARALSPADRARLAALGVRAGHHGLFMPALLKPRAMALRAALLTLAEPGPPALPPAGVVAWPAPADWPAGFARALGWLPAGPVLLRLDIAERVSGELARACRRHPIALPPGLAQRLSIRQPMLPAVLRALGFRLIPAAVLPADRPGPPAPALLALLRPRHPRPQRPARPPASAAGPFAALASLRPAHDAARL